MNNTKNPEQHRTQVLFGDFSILLKLNRYLRAVFQGINQAVIVVDGYVVDHSVPKLFVKLNGRCFKLGEFKEHTTDGNRLGIRVRSLSRLHTRGEVAIDRFLWSFQTPPFLVEWGLRQDRKSRWQVY